MKKIKRSLFWFYLLSKRLIKKPGFLLLLCLIPVFAVGISMLSGQESGMLKIVLCRENEADALSSQIVADLLGQESVLQYVEAESREAAYEAVRSGEADAAWIFPDNMQEQLDSYTAGENYDAKLVTIVEREDNVVLQLSREKLYGALYSYFPYSLYQNYVRHELTIPDELSDETLLENHEAARVEGNLFERAYVTGEPEEETQEENYLTAPLRGMLALVIVLCGLAATMYYLQDEAAGVFDLIPLWHRTRYLYCYQLSGMLYAGVAALVAMWLSGSFSGIPAEVGRMALYLLMCVSFCSVIKRLCGNMKRLGTCIPLLMIGMFVLCPVFFAVRRFRPVQYLLPPFYYLNVVHNGTFLYCMLLYCVIGIMVEILLEQVWKRRFC